MRGYGFIYSEDCGASPVSGVTLSVGAVARYLLRGRKPQTQGTVRMQK